MKCTYKIATMDGKRDSASSTMHNAQCPDWGNVLPRMQLNMVDTEKADTASVCGELDFLCSIVVFTIANEKWIAKSELLHWPIERIR